MWEEKEGVMRNAMTTRAPCGANKCSYFKFRLFFLKQQTPKILFRFFNSLIETKANLGIHLERLVHGGRWMDGWIVSSTSSREMVFIDFLSITETLQHNLRNNPPSGYHFR